jgi:hypothetical protein
VVTARSIPPGGRGEIEVTFNGLGRPGHQEKTVTVLSNDPQTQSLILTIRAMVLTQLGVEPKIADLKTVPWDGEAAVTLELLMRDRAAVRIERIESTSPALSGRLVTEPGEGGKELPIRLEVQLRPGLPPGKIRERLTLHTTSQVVPRLEVPVTGTVLGDFQAEPASLTFLSLREADAGRRSLEVKVTATGEARLRITRLEDTTGFLETAIEEVSPAREFRVKVTPRAGQGGFPPRFSGKLRIHTDSPRQPILELPVYATQGRESGATTLQELQTPPPEPSAAP